MGKMIASTSNRRDAFSLIEVVLAIGVVAFALVGIFSLFSASLKTNRDSSSQQEGFDVAAVVSSRLQDTNFLSTNGLYNLLGPLYISGKTTNYYIYTVSNSIVMTNSAANYSISNSLLYYLQIAASQNLTSATNVFPKPAGVTPAQIWTNWGGFPLQIKVFGMPSASLPVSQITNKVPVMMFDMVIPR
jgi:uncharacterized protein (TIGR02598 family)